MQSKQEAERGEVVESRGSDSQQAALAPSDQQTAGKKRVKEISRDNTPVVGEGSKAAATVGEASGKNRKRRKSVVTQMSATRTLPLLVCSIGNPGSTYANTLHSAGHTVVNRLAEYLGYTQFRKERELGNGLVTRPAITGSTGDWTLWQSTSYMNESGKGVKAAFTTWSKGIPVDEQGRLVVIYDELEKPLGSVTVKTAQGASAKGHNGLKSIMSLMGGTPFARIGIGIDRPVSRESDEVARYVMKKMTPAEKAKIEGCVEEVVAKLKQLERG